MKRLHLRLTPTTINQWQLCKWGEYKKEITDFLKYLKEPFVTNINVELGKAFHKLIELGSTPNIFFTANGAEYEAVEVRTETKVFHFSGSALELANAIREAYQGVHELRVAKTIRHDLVNADIYTEMVIDLAEGLVLHEFKTRMTEKEPVEYMQEMARENYEDSVQWRMYLDAMPEAVKVVYTICYLKEPESLENPVIIDTAFQPYQFELERYDGIKSYILDWMQGLIKFLQYHDCIHLIEQKK